MPANDQREQALEALTYLKDTLRRTRYVSTPEVAKRCDRAVMKIDRAFEYFFEPPPTGGSKVSCPLKHSKCPYKR
jgi:hypothetical protein